MRRISWLVAGGVAAILAVPAGVAVAATPTPTPSATVTSPGPGPGAGPGYGGGFGFGPQRTAPREDCPYWNSPQMQEHRRQMIEKYGPNWVPPRDGTGPLHDRSPGRMGPPRAAT